MSDPIWVEGHSIGWRSALRRRFLALGGGDGGDGDDDGGRVWEEEGEDDPTAVVDGDKARGEEGGDADADATAFSRCENTWRIFAVFFVRNWEDMDVCGTPPRSSPLAFRTRPRTLRTAEAMGIVVSP